MMRRITFCLAAGLLILAGGLLQASYLESDQPDERPSVPIVPRPVPPPPRPPVPHNPLTEMIGRLSVREGYHYRGLTVFLVEVSRVADPTAYLSSEEALAGGTLTVREKGAGSVPSLIVENKGKEAILMLGGELLLGGKQNRVLRHDALLPARSGPVELPVYCTEQGRWSGRGAVFDRRNPVAPLEVRGLAQAGRPQAEIWQSVSAYQTRLHVKSSTGDLQAVQDSPEVQKALKDYRVHFGRHCWRPEAVGMVVARYGRIVGADIFCNARLFRKHRDRLLDSYAVDCIAYSAHPGEALLSRDTSAVRERGPDFKMPPFVVPGREQAERFLRRALRGRFTWRATPGAGRLLVVSGAGLSGTGLVHKGNVLHAGLFARIAVPIVRPTPPVAPPRPIPLPRPLPE